MEPIEQDRHLREQREAFVNEWRIFQKKTERFAGLLMIFSAALLLVMEQSTGDNFTAVASALLIGGGFTMIFRSRRHSTRPTHFYFLDATRLSNRSTIALVSAGVALWLTVQNNRFLWLLGAGWALLVALYYGYQARRVREYDKLFPKTLITNDNDES